METSQPFTAPRGLGAIHLSCGSSDETDLPDRSVDLVITDPPFVDNVHYSELADFFFAWQVLHPRGFVREKATTRHAREVQDTDSERFAEKLGRVFAESRRVLKDDGLLAFTYHHSRPEGWTSLARAVYGGGFSVVNAHPVKSEMSVATPKSQAKEPIQLDVIFVCRKREEDSRAPIDPTAAAGQALRAGRGEAFPAGGDGAFLFAKRLPRRGDQPIPRSNRPDRFPRRRRGCGCRFPGSSGRDHVAGVFMPSRSCLAEQRQEPKEGS